MEHLYIVRSIEENDKPNIAGLLEYYWGSTEVISHGKCHDAVNLAGYVAETNEGIKGWAQFYIEDGQCEIVVLKSIEEGLGIGTRLLDEIKQLAIKEKCKRIWLVTTNDNVYAMRFYQLRDFRFCKVHCDAITKARKIKSGIPQYGIDNISIQDEIEMEILLTI